MSVEYASLFKPFQIGKMKVKNRICMAPMMPGGWLDEGKNLTDRTISYYEERAKGGAGLIFTGASFPNAGLEITDFTKSPFARPDHFRAQTRKLVEAVHKYDCKLIVQMQLGCGRAGVPFILKDTPVAPSAVANRFDPSVTCRELTTEEVYHLIDTMVEAAVQCWMAGADGVNINGVNSGYLGDQFATEAFNHRKDEFGGSLENRLRLVTEICKRIKQICGADFPVTTRLGTKSHMKAERVGHLPGEDYVEFGRDVDESLEAGKLLEAAGFDGIVFGTGSYDSMYWMFPPMYMPDGAYLEEAALLKQKLGIPVICSGKLSDPKLANDAIRDGLIDAVAVGRGMIADAHWANKVKEGKYEEIRPCLSCNNGCIGRVFAGMDMRCAVNADVFYEAEEHEKYRKVDTPKNIAIIGGGVASMEAARVAATRGHHVTIYEKGTQLGGLMLAAKTPKFKDADRRLLAWYELQLKKLGVDVRFNSEMSESDVQKLDADEIVVATGSHPRMIRVPGADLPHVCACEDMLLGKKKPGKHVVVIGGGQVGCETALWLRDEGCEVTIVEALDALMSNTVEPIPQANRDMLLELLVYHNVPTYTGSMVKKITETEVIFDRNGKEERIPADTVVVSIGYVANSELYESVYQNTQKKVWVLGDAKHAGTIMSAIRDGSAVGAIL